MSGNREGTKSVEALRRLLNQRDEAILQSIQQHKFLATRQVYALHFWDHASYGSGIRACTRVLNRLLDHRLIYRLERPVGGHGGGSTSFVWGIDAAGDRLLKADLDPEERKRGRAFEPTTPFLAHTLAVADTRIALEELARAGATELLSVTSEPGTWRRFRDSAGAVSILKPDLAAVTATGDYEDSWFIEVDRGTESIPALLRKCSTYQRYHDTKSEQHAYGVFPLVLWIVPNEARVERLLSDLRKDKQLDPALFIAITPERFAPTISGTANTSPTSLATKGGTSS